MLNDYNKIAGLYAESNTKPDKLYSILPTVLDICDKEKVNPSKVLDLGCGAGFFTFPLAEKFPNAEVTGIDNSEEQIRLAKENLLKYGNATNISFVLGDIFEMEMPKANLILTPFVLGYLEKEKLKPFLDKIYSALEDGGKAILVLDDPQGIDNSRFGARKIVRGENLEIELFNRKQEPITTLHAVLHLKDRVTPFLREVGFKDIQQYEPIISSEGRRVLGDPYWHGYEQNSELCYISCVK